MKILAIFSPHGTIKAANYFIAGFILFSIKYLLDRFIMFELTGVKWLPTNYYKKTELAEQLPYNFFPLFIILTIALPFLWIGICLTIKRARTIGISPVIAALFFVPVVNFILFILLSILPDSTSQNVKSIFDIKIVVPKDDKFIAALMGVVVGSLLGVCLVIITTLFLRNYGYGLFIGTPFLISVTAVLIFATHQRRTYSECLSVSILSLILAGLLLLIFAIEGVICMVMAAPLGLIVGFMGGTAGYLLQKNININQNLALHSFVLPPLLLIFHIAIEPVKKPDLFRVTTELQIDAPIDQVWNHVVSFSDIAPPDNILFKTGIAYPVRARIDGKGVGAIRYCEFSTGSFIEPITAWDEPYKLAFDVISTPPPMNEWSIFSHIHPPHLEEFFHSRKGLFELEETPSGGTLLKGSTWYEHRISPAYYWKFFSDKIVQAIHLRVLRHIKKQAEVG